MKSTFWESLRIDVLRFVLMDVSAEAYDALDPAGNITIKWDVISWTPDGYVVSINELQFSFYVILVPLLDTLEARFVIEFDSALNLSWLYILIPKFLLFFRAFIRCSKHIDNLFVLSSGAFKFA